MLRICRIACVTSVLLPNVCWLNVLTRSHFPKHWGGGGEGSAPCYVSSLYVLCAHTMWRNRLCMSVSMPMTPYTSCWLFLSSLFLSLLRILSKSFHSLVSPSFSFLPSFFSFSYSTYFLLSPFIPCSSSLQWREGSAGEEETLSSQPNKACNAQSFGGGLWRPVRKGLFSMALCVVLLMVCWKWRGCEMKNV